MLPATRWEIVLLGGEKGEGEKEWEKDLRNPRFPKGGPTNKKKSRGRRWKIHQFVLGGASPQGTAASFFAPQPASQNRAGE